jgi:hypothetical protein
VHGDFRKACFRFLNDVEKPVFLMLGVHAQGRVVELPRADACRDLHATREPTRAARRSGEAERFRPQYGIIPRPSAAPHWS